MVIIERLQFVGGLTLAFILHLQLLEVVDESATRQRNILKLIGKKEKQEIWIREDEPNDFSLVEIIKNVQISKIAKFFIKAGES